MAQGYPDPYSALSQGLGPNIGMEIMQMIQQKAQAEYDRTDKRISANMVLLKDPNVPKSFKDSLWPQVREDFKKTYPKIELSENYEWDDDLPKKISSIQNNKAYEGNPNLKNKLIKELIATSNDPVKSLGRFDYMLKENERDVRKQKIEGTPPTGLVAPPTGDNPDTIPRPNTMYGLTGDATAFTQGQPGLRTMAQDAEMSPLETESMLAEYEQTGKFDVPKDGSSKTGPEWDEKARQIGMALELHPEAVTSEEKAWLRAYKEQKIATAVERNKVFGSVPTAIPGVYYDRLKKQYVEDGVVLSAGEVRARGIDYKEDTSMAGQRGGAATANISAANELYQKNLPRLIELRNLVANKGLLPETEFTDLNALSQWLDMKGSDPDMAELQGKVKLMADNLQKTIGGAQGGEWAFKVADTLLNPALAPEAFKRRMESHGEDLSYLATARRSFGKTYPKRDKPPAPTGEWSIKRIQ